jgi:hypothetical protein
MTEPIQNTKKISRRDAIKLLGAVTGATVLANLPSKWSTPEIAKGVLPAHAQTSTLFSFVSCTGTAGLIANGLSNDLFLEATITPAASNISINLAIESNSGVNVVADPSTNYLTDNLGEVLSFLLRINSNTSGAQIVFRWTFNNPAEGTDFCDSTITFA